MSAHHEGPDETRYDWYFTFIIRYRYLQRVLHRFLDCLTGRSVSDQ